MGATRHGQTSGCASAVRMEREDQGGHRESARSADADDGEGVGEGAEVDNALPRRRQLVRGLLLDLGCLGLLELDASLGLVLLVLDLERAELVAPSEDAVVLQKGGEGAWSTRSPRSVGRGQTPRARDWVA